MASSDGPSRLDHVGIAVRSIAEARRFYEALGLRLEGEEEVAEQTVRVGFLALGETRLELLEPTGPQSPIARHLDRRGPGLHHLCVSVPDIRAAMARLAGAGFELLSDEPRPGAHGCQVCFIHPTSAGGILIELSQPPPRPPLTRGLDPRRRVADGGAAARGRQSIVVPLTLRAPGRCRFGPGCASLVPWKPSTSGH